MIRSMILLMYLLVFVVNKVQPVKNESENFLNDAKMISETLKGSKLNFASKASQFMNFCTKETFLKLMNKVNFHFI